MCDPGSATSRVFATKEGPKCEPYQHPVCPACPQVRCGAEIRHSEAGELSIDGGEKKRLDDRLDAGLRYQAVPETAASAIRPQKLLANTKTFETITLETDVGRQHWTC